MADQNHPPLVFKIHGVQTLDKVDDALQKAPWIAKYTSRVVCTFERRVSDTRLQIMSSLLRQSDDIQHLSLFCMYSPDTIIDIVDAIRTGRGSLCWDHLQSLDLYCQLELGTKPLRVNAASLLFQSVPSMRIMKLNTILDASILGNLKQLRDGVGLDYLAGPLDVHEALCTSDLASPLPTEICVNGPADSGASISPSVRMRDMLAATTPRRLEGVHVMSVTPYYSVPQDLWRLTRLRVLAIRITSQQTADQLFADMPSSLQSLQLTYRVTNLNIEQLTRSLEGTQLKRLRRLVFRKMKPCTAVELEFYRVALQSICTSRRIVLEATIFKLQ